MTTNFFKSLSLVLIMGYGASLMAAVPQSLSSGVDLPSKQILEALKLPMDNRLQALRAHGARAVNELAEMSFDRNRPLQVRWRALTALPYLDRDIGTRTIEKALKSDEWYLRNAATVALPALERAYALELSAQLLSDPALVVRTAAAQNILRLGGKEKEALLWEKLNAKENFRNGESLWVRRHIAKALAEFAKSGAEAKFVSLLSDQDARLHPFAIRGLERLTGRKLNKDKVSLKEHRSRWIAWWRDQEP